MSNGTGTLVITGIPNTVTVQGKYPPTVTPGQNGYPGPEDGPKAIPPGCAFGLPTITFGGPWQPYTVPTNVQPG
jgi:hypothetical protein